MGRIFFEGLADHTSAKKGEVLKVITDGTNFKVSFPEGYLNITEQLGQKDRMYIAHIGLALAVYDGAGGLEICEYFSYHTHTKYSILDGMNEVGNIAKLSSGISAISEHGNMFSFLEWQKAMEKNHKHPVFAFEAYVEDADEALIGKSIEEALGSTLEGEKNGSHLVLIAMDDEGLRNLFSLTTEAYYNFHKKPHISLESLKAHSKGVACTSACISGEIAKLLRDNDYEGAKKVAEFYKAIFGEDYYLEIQRHFLECEESVNKNLIRLSKELDIKLIAANDSHWEKEEDELAHDYLLCVRSKDSINNPNHPTFDGDGYEYFSDHQMIDRFWDMPETIKSGLELASKCTARVVTGEYHTPKYPLPEGYQSEEEYLTYLANKGFREKYGEGTEELRNRFSYELSVVLQMGYAGYFLIVWDYVSWAKSQGIYVGPGRGSAVGSVLSYCLDITNLEPTKYGLMFERFLNPERVSMPDIDVDFQHDRRPEVIEYVKGLGTDVVSPKDVYFKGYITSITEAYGTQYGNATFEVSDTEDGGNRFLCYRVKYFDGQSYSNPSDPNIKDKDLVVMCGKVVNYKGTTPETSANAAWLYSLNGTTLAATLGTLDTPLTVADALEYISKLEDNGTTKEDAYVAGKITKILSTAENIAKYKNIDYVISDGTNELTVFRGRNIANNDFTEAGQINEGDEVVVFGKLTKYVKDGIVTPEVAQDNYIVSLTKGSGGEGADGSIIVTVADFNAAAESTDVWYQLTGTVKNLKDNDQYGNFDLEDSTGSVYVYGLLSEKGGAKKKFQELVAAEGIKNGSMITIVGNRGSYNGKIEVRNAYFIKVENVQE